MRTRTRGIQLADDGSRVVNKQYLGERIFERLGKVSQDAAEAWLRNQQAGIDAERANSLRRGDERLWADAAKKYLSECEKRKVRTLGMISRHVVDLLPFIGTLPMRDVCNDALEGFKLDRQDDGVKNSTINRSLEVVRTTVIRAARVWRDGGKPWLATAPLIEMLDEKARKREPHPINRQEQAQLLKRLPGHLQAMVEFALNTGARDENVCGLRWEWEVQVPELKRSVFVIPAEVFKSGRRHVLVLNDVAWAIVQRQRDRHGEFVFVYRKERVKNLDLAPVMPYRRVGSMNNTAFQEARTAVGLQQVRVHDLRHTFGQRLRDAGVPEEDRSLLLGHAVEGMAQHYATATLERLLKAANSVTKAKDRTMVLRVVNG
ncbi:tyrosine-type recombinase/integrase [uncultured Ramlibacter sp.]|uniref:tyrosine-type recombinase/integrase n=1 Tax=uncultured Ramlibacter sp. TaxID=260755 RepID=UPI0026103AFB|nr:tyrosine-type recombinase/integrase [uncultured Ramlibacter sp.]